MEESDFEVYVRAAFWGEIPDFFRILIKHLSSFEESIPETELTNVNPSNLLYSMHGLFNDYFVTEMQN